MKAKNKELMEKAQEMLIDAKREFEGSLDQTMDGLEAKLEEMRKATATMSEEAKQTLEKQLKSLSETNADILQRLEKLKSEGAESWNAIKALVFDLWQELQKSFDENMDPTQITEV